MPFSRSFLKSIGLTDEQVTAVMDEHVSVTDALKQQRDAFKADAEKVPALNQQIAALEAEKGYKKKYEDEHTAHEALKQKIVDDEAAAKVKAAYRQLLIDEKVSDKHLDTVLQFTDFSGMKLDKDGKLENEKELREAGRQKWGDFIVTTSERGAHVSTPPAGGKAVKTKEEIFAIKDTAERQKAIAENHELFGF